MRVRWGYVLLVVVLLAIGALTYGCGAKPTVVIHSPPNDFEVSEGDELVVDVTATGGGKIERVELLVDDVIVDMSISPSPPVSLNAQLDWIATGVGKHTVKAKAYNTNGQVSDVAAIMVNVVEGVAVAPPGGEGEPAPEEVVVATPTPEEEAAATATPTHTPTVTPTGTPPPGAPVLSFWVDSATVKHDQPFTLSWHEENATALYLSGPEVGTNVGVTGPDGSKTVCSGSVGCPDIGDQLYVLRAEGPGGVTEKSVTVHVTVSIPIEGLHPLPIKVVPSFTAAFDGTVWCQGTYAEFKIANTGTVALESVSIRLVKMPGETPISTSSDNAFHGPLTPCNLLVPAIHSGYYAMANGYVGGAAPGSFRAYVKVCSEDDLGGGCSEKTVDFTL